MKSVVILLICAVLCATAQPQQPPQQPQQPQSVQHKEGPKGFVPLRELKDLKFLPTDMKLRGSVATATDTLFRACVAHEPNTAALFITPRTVIVHRSLLPSGGMYRGMIGLLDFAYKCKLSFNSKSFEYSVIAVDEARGYSIVRIKYSGSFIRTGSNVETTATVYMHWRLGKLSKIMLVDDNPKALLSAYETKAEKVVCQFYNALFACQGTECPEAVKYLDDNIKHSVSMYPESIAKRLSYEGVAGFKKHVASPDSKWLLDRVTNINPIFGDNTTVISCMSLGRGSDAKKAIATSRGVVNYNALPGNNLDLDSLSDLSIISITKVNEAGKIVSCDQQLSQPIMPWHFRTLGLLGMETAKEVPKIVANQTKTDKPVEKKQ